MKKCFLGSSGLVLLALASGCSEPYSAPEAIITRLDAANAGDPADCLPMVDPLDGRVGSVAPFTGSCSQDPESRSLAFQWSLVDSPSGSMSMLSHSDLVTPTFAPDVPGAYRLRLVVSNGVLTSQPAEADLVVGRCGDRAPVAVPTASSMAPFTGESVQLDVGVDDDDTLSDCAAHGDMFEYTWSFVELPAGSRAELNDPAVHDPSFTADVPGNYTLRIVVSDPTSRLSEARQIQLAVAPCGDHAPVITSVASSPSAAPATGQVVRVSPTFNDADLEAGCEAHAAVFSYAWQLEGLPIGSQATLNQEHTQSPSFTPDVPGDYRLRLIITDPTGRSTSRLETITASVCGTNRPVITSIDSTPSAAPATGQAVSVSPTFTDADLEAGCEAHAGVFSYAWQLEGLPTGSQATLNQQQTQNPSFTPDVPGDYRLRLVITDPTGRSTSQVQTITASTCGTNPPVATASASSASASPNDPIQLQGDATDADTDTACGLDQTLSYSWSWAALPAGSGALLSSPRAQFTGFQPDVPGTYTAELVVTDSRGLSSEPVRTNVTVDACGTAAPVAAAQKVGPGSTVTCGASAIAVNLNGNNDVLLDAATSSDPDNGACGLSQTLFYSWSLLTTPLDGGGSRLRTADGRTTVLDADSNGEYRVRLLVTDSTGRVSREATCILNLSNAG